MRITLTLFLAVLLFAPWRADLALAQQAEPEPKAEAADNEQPAAEAPAEEQAAPEAETEYDLSAWGDPAPAEEAAEGEGEQGGYDYDDYDAPPPEEVFEPGVDFHGSYARTRAVFIDYPYAQKEKNYYPENVAYVRHKLHFAPAYKINEYVELHAEFDTFFTHLVPDELNENLTDDDTWGGTEGTVLKQSAESHKPNFVLRRVYGKITTPIGIIEAGRIPSHVGMGLLTNDGEHPTLFGDTNHGDTYDRFLFGTMPFGKESNVITAIAYDRIWQGSLSDNIGSKADNLDEIVAVVAYNEDEVITAAAYFVYRWQDSTGTKAYIPDVYLKLDFDLIRIEAEGLWVGGETHSAPKIDLSDLPEVTLPKTKLDLWSYVARIGLGQMLLDPVKMLQFEWGEVSGDSRPFDPTFDGTFSAYTVDPDFNVGLIMWEEAFARKTLSVYRDKVDLINNTLVDLGAVEEGSKEHQALLDSASMLYSEGGLTNCLYIYPSIVIAPLEELNIKAAYLTAWAHYAYDTNLDGKPDASFYGHEFDLGLEYVIAEHVWLVGEFGYFLPGNIFNEPKYRIDRDGDRVYTGTTRRAENVMTLQGKIEVKF